MNEEPIRFDIYADLILKVGKTYPQIDEIKEQVEAVRKIDKSPNGMFIMYSDYEKLKKDYEQLKKIYE